MIGTERFKKKLQKIKRRGERQKAKHELESRYAEFYPSKKRKVSNVMLVAIIVNITIYTIASFWLTYVSGVSVDSTLTTAFFAFWGTEIVLLAGIKCSKVLKSSVDENSDEDSLG